jgi:hypothetical protein
MKQILVKPRAYRHLLFNRPHLHLPKYDDKATSNKVKIIAKPSSLLAWWTVLRQLLALFLVDACELSSNSTSNERNNG